MEGRGATSAASPPPLSACAVRPGAIQAGVPRAGAGIGPHGGPIARHASTAAGGRARAPPGPGLLRWLLAHPPGRRPSCGQPQAAALRLRQARRRLGQRDCADAVRRSRLCARPPSRLPAGQVHGVHVQAAVAAAARQERPRGAGVGQAARPGRRACRSLPAARGEPRLRVPVRMLARPLSLLDRTGLNGQPALCGRRALAAAPPCIHRRAARWRIRAPGACRRAFADVCGCRRALHAAAASLAARSLVAAGCSVARPRTLAAGALSMRRQAHPRQAVHLAAVLPELRLDAVVHDIHEQHAPVRSPNRDLKRRGARCPRTPPTRPMPARCLVNTCGHGLAAPGRKCKRPPGGQPTG